MKDLLKNKKNIIVILAIVLVIVCLILIVCFFNKDKKDNDSTKNFNNYEKEIVKIGKDYYEKVYYPLLDNPKEMLKDYSEFGIKIDLEILNSYKAFSNDVNNYLSSKECNYETSKVIIIPKSNYKVNSYDVDISLDCNK